MATIYGRLLKNPNNTLGQPWYWQVARAGNHEELARSSETYTNRRDAIYSYDLVVDRRRAKLWEFKDGKTPTDVTD